MSLCLLDQKLGSHSQSDASSHKFSLKGRQTGGMHRGHSWVFRAESSDTMMAWYEDIRNLTEKSGEEKSAFVRRHARSASASSFSGASSDGMEEDEADAVPYSAGQSMKGADQPNPQQRPEPGGRFPSSDLMVHRRERGVQAPPSHNSSSSDERDGEGPAVAHGALGQTKHHTYGSHRAEAEITERGPQSNDLKMSTQRPMLDAQGDEGNANGTTLPVVTKSSGVDHADWATNPNEAAALRGGQMSSLALESQDQTAGTFSGTRGPHDESDDASQRPIQGDDIPITGHMGPKVTRQDTSNTLSDIHIPGEWSRESRG